MKKTSAEFIHICPDEKFIDSAISLFESVDNDNHQYIVITKNEDLEYIKNSKVIKTSPLSLFFFVAKNREYFKNKKVILHSAPRFSKIIALLLSSKTKILWIGFGYDYYCYQSKNSKKITTRLDRFFLKKINFFSPVLASEYMLIKNYEPQFKAKLLDWNYDVITDFFSDDNFIDKGKILIGNSATKTNNHIDIFDKLIEMKLNGDREIIIPLSYGSESYREEIKKHIDKLPLNFIPLFDFIDIKSYYEMLSGCSHVIMNHDRQQAYGNILMSLYFGAKVFLKENNPIYVDLINKGLILFTIDDVFFELDSSLNYENKKNNKNLICDYYSREMFESRTKNVLIEMKTQ